MAKSTISATTTTATPVAKSKRPSSNRTLVQRAQSGDGDAFDELFELNKNRVYCLCLSMTKDISQAEDLTQEVFLQVFRHLTTFRGDSAFSTWVHRIAVNTMLMKTRRRKRPPIVSLDELLSPDSSSPRRELGTRDPNLSSAIERMAVHRAIEELPEGCRTVVHLYAIHGYQHHEIAKLLQCSIGNSKSQLHRAKVKMRTMLSPKWGASLLRKASRSHAGGDESVAA